MFPVEVVEVQLNTTPPPKKTNKGFKSFQDPFSR